jgi:hypothetical protein
VVFVFALLMFHITFIDLCTLNHLWDEADLFVVNDLSDMLLDSVCHYFIEDFCIDFHSRDWLVVVIFGCVLVWFSNGCNAAFIELVRQCSFLF